MPSATLLPLLTAEDDLPEGTTAREWYLYGDEKERLAGPAATKEELLQQVEGGEAPEGAEFYVVPSNQAVLTCGSVTDDEEAAAKPCPGGVSAAQPWYYLYKYQPNDAENPIPELTGEDLSADGTRQDFDPQTGQPIVLLDFTDEGGDKFHDITRELSQRGALLAAQNGVTGRGEEARQFAQSFAIVLDNEIRSFPIIDFTDPQLADGIAGGSAQITGLDGIQEAKDLALVLQTGALPVEFVQVDSTQISATLGEDSLRQALIAGIGGLIAVALFLLIVYRFLGVVAIIGLAVYGVFLYGAILAFNVTMTLPGIAGIILTIGVAADANIVIFERIKEEVRAGQIRARRDRDRLQQGLRHDRRRERRDHDHRGRPLHGRHGQRQGLRAHAAARDAHLDVHGRARHPSAARRPLAASAGSTTRASWARAPRRSRTGRRSTSSGSGGSGSRPPRSSWSSRSARSSSRASTSASTSRAAARSRSRPRSRRPWRTCATKWPLSAAPTPSSRAAATRAAASTRSSRSRPSRCRRPSRTSSRRSLENDLGAESIGVRNVSGSFSEQILRGAIYAIIASLILIVIYVTIRFEFIFALPIFRALFYDITVAMGVYALFGWEVTAATVAALLTILGYSMYDTIIIFDRVRENIPLMRKSSFAAIANQSLWETVRRSLATTLITLLPILSLILFGGDTLKEFAFALLIGIASGAFSTIFIATPFLAVLKEREPEFARRKDAGLQEKLDTVGEQSAGGADEQAEPEAAPEPEVAEEPVAVAEEDGELEEAEPVPAETGTRKAPTRGGRRGGSAAARGRMAEPGNGSASDRSLRATAEELFLAGVGVVALTKERTDELVDELASRGKVSRDDARGIVDEVVGRWRGDALRVGERAGATFSGLFRELGLVTRREYEELELRLAQLEHRLRLVEKELSR